MSRILFCMLAGLCWSAVAVADEPTLEEAPLTAPVEKAELLSPPRFAALKARVSDWVAARGVTDAVQLDQLATIWEETEDVPSAEVLLEKVVSSFCLVDPDSKAFVSQLELPNAPLIAPQAKPLTDDRDPFYLSNMRLYYGRYLAHRQMYEEALEVFSLVKANDVVDPASYLFFKATCEKRLLLKEEGLKSIDQLLKNTEGVPVRYSTVATLMRYDLEAIKDKSLDEVSWKMQDVERRLKLARGGQKVQKVEEEIVTLLDEIIKKIEEQQGGGGGGGGSGDGQSNSNQSSSPANDSRVKGSTAPGETDKKNFKNVGGWGDLDDKERARAKNLISRDFPAHYRKAVEEYFKKIANRKAEKK